MTTGSYCFVSLLNPRRQEQPSKPSQNLLLCPCSFNVGLLSFFFSLVPEVFLAPGMLREPAFSSTWCSLEKGIRDFPNFFAEIPVVQLLNTSYTVEVGQSVTLGCRIVTALPSATNVYWSRFINNAYDRVAIDNVRYFGSTVGNPNLTITNVALSDATSYQCSATNTAGTGNSAMAMLLVTGSEYSKVFPLHVF